MPIYRVDVNMQHINDFNILIFEYDTLFLEAKTLSIINKYMTYLDPRRKNSIFYNEKCETYNYIISELSIQPVTKNDIDIIILAEKNIKKCKKHNNISCMKKEIESLENMIKRKKRKLDNLIDN